MSTFIWFSFQRCPRGQNTENIETISDSEHICKFAVADVEIYLEMGLDKDHKEMKEGALPATRPVVSGCAGMSLSMSNILSDIIEALADARKDPPEVISTEDFKSRPPPQKISSIKAWIQPIT